jgi:cobyrinic acid a,c-diamide synthase
VNLDAFAMPQDRIRALAAGPGTLIIEGAMGLFDGAPPDGKGSSAHLAKALNAPVLLIVDAAHMAGSVAALAEGFARHDPQVQVAGIILNKVGSSRHEVMLRHALAPLGLPVLGAVPRTPDLTMPSRHLGLVQAGEHSGLEAFIQGAARLASEHIDLDAMAALSAPLPNGQMIRVPPPGQRIAVAMDQAFAFIYPHLLDDWKAQGAEISLFSPLADEGPEVADFIYLPGGYPELHAARLSASHNFMHRMKNAAQVNLIY